jgi:hypothetical protein
MSVHHVVPAYLNLDSMTGTPEMTDPNLAALSCSSNSGTATSAWFFGICRSQAKCCFVTVVERAQPANN